MQSRLRDILLKHIDAYLAFNPLPVKKDPEPAKENQKFFDKVGTFFNVVGDAAIDAKNYVGRGFSGAEGSIRADKYGKKIRNNNEGYDDATLFAVVFKDVVIDIDCGELESSAEFRKYLNAALCEFLNMPMTYNSVSKELLSTLYFRHLKLDEKELDRRTQEGIQSYARGVALGSGSAMMGAPSLDVKKETQLIRESMISAAVPHVFAAKQTSFELK